MENAPNPRIEGYVPALDGVRGLDLAARTSDDNGLTWRSASDNIGDGIHYSETVRDWLADQVVSIMLALVPN